MAMIDVLNRDLCFGMQQSMNKYLVLMHFGTC